MESIRVNRGITVEVNDDGETILLDVNNQTFMERYNHLLKEVENVKDSIDENKEVTRDEYIEIVIQTSKKLVKAIDECFGEDTCKKVFGKDVLPDAFSILDFLEQINPLVEKYVTEREHHINEKYAKRTGGKK